MKMNACTIVARNYLAYARVLAASYARHHPGQRLSVLVLDGAGAPLEPDTEPFETVVPEQLSLSTAAFHEMATMYDVTELATAVKPFFLRFLLDRGADVAMFLDPDIEVFGPLEELGALAREHDIVLIPHTLRPVPDDGRRPTFAELASSGVYNLGFIALGGGAGAFLDWWEASLRRNCIIAPDEQLFVDQRLIDFLPALFPPHVVRDPAYDVAYWNLHERRIAWTGGGYSVNGGPLRFFHFSGFNPLNPTVLSKHQGTTPRTVLGQEPDLARLCREYADEVLAAGHRHCASLPYGFGTAANGVRLDRRMRRMYREGLLAAEDGAGALPPDPFDPVQADAFIDWLNQPGTKTPGLPRYLRALYLERSDLRRAFPDLSGPDLSAYLQWAREDGGADPPIPSVFRAASLRPTRERAAPAPGPSSEGVNIAGYVRAELGTGEGARLTVAAVKAAGIPYAVIDYGEPTFSRQQHPFDDFGSAVPSYDVNVLAVNADMTPRFARDHPEVLRGRYTIGVWAWEVESFPDEMASAERFVDEIWAISRFAADAIAKKVSKPVFAYPLPVVPPSPPRLSRADLGMPDDFLFLFCFDFFSIVERKNPKGLIEAFSRAFAPGEGPVLVIKSINGDQRKDDLEAVRGAAAGRRDILVVDGYLAHGRVQALMGSCDAYVSLHRGEGFGLTMAEAMALGKPVIATGYSANLEFMNAANSYLVPFTLTPIPPGCEPYPVDALWATPDLDAAGRLMRHVYEHRDDARRVGERARADILSLHSPQARGAFIQSRLAAIRRQRAAAAGSARQTSLTDEAAPVVAAGPPDEASAPRGPLHEAAQLVAAPPPLGSRHAPIRLLQRILLRILRPLLNHERSVGAKLVETMVALQGAIDRTDEHVREVAAAMARGAAEERRERAAELEALRRQLAEDRERTAPRLDDLARRADDLAQGVEQLARRADDLARRADEAPRRFDELARRLDGIAEVSSGHGDRIAGLWADLHTAPHVWDPSLVSGQTDPGGPPVVGYHSAIGGPAAHPYLDFEQIFRGPEATIRDRQRPYLEILEGRAPVLDVGCGRGEMLDLCREAGVSATGVDADAGMVGRCRAKGHRVEHADALDYLSRQASGSVRAIFSAQFIEHLPYERLIEFLRLSYQVLPPDGVFVAETVNPHSVQAFKAFWTDITHQRPIFPETLLALCRLQGFEAASIVFPTGTGDAEVDRWRAGDYAIVARRGAAVSRVAPAGDE
jgi:glycosyltransferase involved in cell wall biosynthesis/SAM-dependent methyltransferase